MSEETTNQNIAAGPDVYVVTRDRRRTSDRNFRSEYDAQSEVKYWINIVRKYDPRSKISVVKTNKPKRVR